MTCSYKWMAVRKCLHLLLLLLADDLYGAGRRGLSTLRQSQSRSNEGSRKDATELGLDRRNEHHWHRASASDALQ